MGEDFEINSGEWALVASRRQKVKELTAVDTRRDNVLA
jgi:hypothetical protein